MSKTEWHGRGSHQYNKDIHIPMLHEVFEKGEGVAAFCASADIAEKTFREWKSKYPEFEENYKVAVIKGAAKWEKLPLELAERGITINHQYWVAINRNRYRYKQHELEKEKEDTTLSRMAAAWISMQNGGITPQEYNQIASGLSTESKINELELQKEIVNQLKESDNKTKEITDEALRAFMLVKSGKGKVVEND